MAVAMIFHQHPRLPRRHFALFINFPFNISSSIRYKTMLSIENCEKKSRDDRCGHVVSEFCLSAVVGRTDGKCFFVEVVNTTRGDGGNLFKLNQWMEFQMKFSQTRTAENCKNVSEAKFHLNDKCRSCEILSG